MNPNRARLRVAPFPPTSVGGNRSEGKVALSVASVSHRLHGDTVNLVPPVQPLKASFSDD